MTVGGLIPSQTYKDLVACEDNTAVSSSLYFFNHSFRIEYASMTTFFDFQFPESHKIFFCWDADVRPKSEIHPISVFKNFEFLAP